MLTTKHVVGPCLSGRRAHEGAAELARSQDDAHSNTAFPPELPEGGYDNASLKPTAPAAQPSQDAAISKAITSKAPLALAASNVGSLRASGHKQLQPLALLPAGGWSREASETAAPQPFPESCDPADDAGAGRVSKPSAWQPSANFGPCAGCWGCSRGISA